MIGFKCCIECKSVQPPSLIIDHDDCGKSFSFKCDCGYESSWMDSEEDAQTVWNDPYAFD